jgi:tRNA(Ile)-lysidine synthase
VRRLGVAVSGGPDSIALLHLLVELASRSPGLLDAMVVLHVHHGLRGEAADADEDFARRRAEALGLAFASARVDTLRERGESGDSVELAARRLRYAAFRRWAGELQLHAIATGHNLDDQAETVLYRALRGTGLRGLAGIPARRGLELPSGRAFIIRPLLDWRRSELRAYLDRNGLTFREDPSNADQSIPRNFLRGTLLPLAEAHVHAGAIRSLARLGLVAREHAAGVLRVAETAFRSARLGAAADRIALGVSELRRWPSVVAREAVHLALEAAGAGSPGPRPHLGYRDSRTLARWLSSGGPATGRMELACRGTPAGTVTLELRYGEIRVVRSAGASGLSDAAIRLPLDGVPVRWGGWEIVGRVYSGEVEPPASGWIEERLDAERVASLGDLWIRARRSGDRFWPLGAPGRKKLKELFREGRIHPRDRGRVPLVAAAGEIIWVVGLRLAHPYRVEPGTSRRLVLRARRTRGDADGLT